MPDGYIITGIYGETFKRLSQGRLKSLGIIMSRITPSKD